MHTMIPEHISTLADERLANAGFYEKSLAELQIPEVNVTPDGVKHVLIGNRLAPNVVLQSAPYLTDLQKPHYRLRLAAQQAALGEDYAMLGVQAYDPQKDVFGRHERAQLAKGDFSPLSARVLRAAAESGVDVAEATFMPYGYSLGGDVAIQTAHDVLLNESRGVVDVRALGAFEFARCKKRGVMVVKAMGDSGKGLYENVCASEMPALDEAWNIQDGPSDRAKKRFDAGVNKDVVRYMQSGARSNLAIVRGFGTGMSTRQLTDVLQYAQQQEDGLYVMAGRQNDSTVCPILPDADTFKKQYDALALPGDHSADDHIRNSARRILYFASNAVPRS